MKRGSLNLPEGSIRAIITLSVVWTYLGLVTLRACGPLLGVAIDLPNDQFSALVMTVVGAYFAMRPPLAARKPPTPPAEVPPAAPPAAPLLPSPTA